MGLSIDSTNVVTSTQYEEYSVRNRDGDKPNSVFGSSIQKVDLAILCGIPIACAIGLAMVRSKNTSGFKNKYLTDFLNKRQFKTLEEARKFGKTKIIRALQKKEPYEHIVIIDKDTNTIIGQAKGNIDSVGIDTSVIKPTGHYSIEHGHPTACIINGKPTASPLSIDDYMSGIWQSGAENVIAYDVNGKFSMLSRKPDFRRLTEDEMQHYYDIFLKIKNDTYLEEMLKYLPEEYQSVTSVEQLDTIYLTLKKYGLPKELDKQFQKAYKAAATRNAELSYKYDRFWKTYADDLGVVYKSNFEYLTQRNTNIANMSEKEFAEMILEDRTIDLKLMLKFAQYITSKGNINALKEAYAKGDLKTFEKICDEHARIIAAATRTASPTGTMTRVDFIKYMNEKLTPTGKINVNSLTDSEVRNLAKLFGTTEEQIRKMDKHVYKRLCFQTHPDRNPNDNMAKEVFTILQHLEVA